MKLYELIGVPGDEPSAKGHYIGDVIGGAKQSKSLLRKQTAGEKKHADARTKTMAMKVSEDLGQVFTEFHLWLRGSDISAVNMTKLMQSMEAEAKARGTPLHTMLDDLMSPLTVDQLRKVIKDGDSRLVKVAREELSHRQTVTKFPT